MNCTMVTITGADDSTDIRELADISDAFPFVEWGILVSQKHAGSPRFPSYQWIEKFTAITVQRQLRTSLHVCGLWTRELLLGNLDWDRLPFSVHAFPRLQINTHAEAHMSADAMAENMRVYNKQYIFQWDGVNGHRVFAAKAYGINVAVLFDTSGGAGISPKSWPSPIKDIYCGYAGGIGPDNVVAALQNIEAVCGRPYWIDMERRVRTEDDSALDIAKVRRVLVECLPFTMEAVL